MYMCLDAITLIFAPVCNDLPFPRCMQVNNKTWCKDCNCVSNPKDPLYCWCHL